MSEVFLFKIFGKLKTILYLCRNNYKNEKIIQTI